jgi:2-succinyl-5-enolpyruvyl-6-hydroxy-3-cyclohexene-1-carboxylate synthase
MMMTNEQILFAYVGAFADELWRTFGVQHAVVCPGSRSTPLALMLAQKGRLQLWTHVDERSAGFFALGLAKARRDYQGPVVLVCTSGTAAANFLPAVVEAHYARVPLLVLTADRPHELRDFGAPQTIDQVRLYGIHAKWFADMLPPEATPEALRYARTMAGRAVATAMAGPAGVVHLNFPFREPLTPAPVEDPPSVERGIGRPYVTVRRSEAEWPDGALIDRLVTKTRPSLSGVERGLIVCGPYDNPKLALSAAVTSLAKTLGWPVLADPLSSVRRGWNNKRWVIDAYDAFLRDEAWVADHAPDLILRFGAIPTSKPLLLYLQRYPETPHIVVDEDGGWNDPTLLAAEFVHAHPGALCRELIERLGDQTPSSLSAWTADWMAAQAHTRVVLNERLARMDEFFEGKVFTELADLLPRKATLYVGNSMPIRDCDTFFPAIDKHIRILANRGANGIDGVVSSALGASVESEGPLVLVIGDLSFYHDMNGLLAARLHGLNATIIVLNNDGGGIFSFLPQAGAADPATFEQLFGTPTGLDFRPAVEMYGGRFLRPATWPEFRQAVSEGTSGKGLTVIEVRTDRAHNVAQHRALWPAVAEALRSEF